MTELGSSFTRTSALMNGSVASNGGTLSSCRFEYGTSKALGHEADCAYSENGNENCAFSTSPSAECAFPDDRTLAVYARLFGLSPGTTYYFRLVAENEGAKAAAQEGSFTTAPALSSPKSITPPAKAAATGPSSSELAALIAKQLAPSGRAAAISALLRHGVFSAPFKAPEAGTATIDWYYLPRGAKLAKASHGPKPLLVASGALTFKAAGTITIKLHLSEAGKSLLRHATKIRLTARCVFTPAGHAAVATLKSFELKR